MVEQSLAEVDGSLVEAAQSFGASNLQIVFKVLLFESLPSLVRGAALTFITLFGFSAMAGTVGAGGLGDIAIRYGYQRFEIYSTTGPSTTLLAFYMAIATNLYSVYIFIKPNLSTKFSEFNFGVPGTTTPLSNETKLIHRKLLK